MPIIPSIQRASVGRASLNRCRRHLLTLAACALAMAVAPVHAKDEFPSRPIMLVVPFGVGGAGDQLARALGKAVTDRTGTPVVVENRVGASGTIGASYVARAKPDGYTVLLGTNTTQIANRYLFKTLTYDPAKDFDPITAVSRGDQIVLVRPSLGVKSMAQLIELAKSKPGRVSYGSGSSSSQVTTSMLEKETGIELLSVPYKSNSLAVVDLLAGQLDMIITDTATALAHVRQGTLVPLAVTGDGRAPDAPEVPTVREVLRNSYSAMPWFNALYVPKGTPPEVTAKLNRIFTEATASTEAENFYKSSGSTRFISTPAELTKFQQEQDVRWKQAIAASGIQPN
ncbi:MAG: tripartite tricarboxylate transporter substrate binding protein [Bordetella sp.]|nr:tripartite tricarboxylate transporter substrate binding protein [Bordetella sp.]